MLAPKCAVLYVEDDDGDRFFMENAFQSAGLASALHMVADGRAAVQYLSGSGPYADRTQHPVPGFVLLDLNLPLLSGFEVLEWIRNHPDYKTLPVVILSSSSHPDDPLKAKAMGATDFWQKPANGLHYSKIVAHLRDQWLSSVSGSTRPGIGESPVWIQTVGELNHRCGDAREWQASRDCHTQRS